MRRALLPLGLLLALPASGSAQPSPLSVNPASREEVRQFYRSVYLASENIAWQWNGSYATGDAGDSSAALKEATRLRLNFFRALAGVPADIAFDSSYSAKAQQAALLMSVNNTLSHAPSPGWKLYSPGAAEGARHSNLTLGQVGPDAIDNYIMDAGDENSAVGHRRWILYPQTLAMGTGDVPGITGNHTRRAANAVWVLDTTPGGEFGAPRPTTRTTAIMYPPAGFVPYPLVWPRWSFSHPDADFSAASVTLTRLGQPVPVRLEPLAENLGEPTLVWICDQLDADRLEAHPRPERDLTYSVRVSNVRIGSVSRDFTYDVTVFDPELPGRDALPAQIIGSTRPEIGRSTAYQVLLPPYLNGFEWRAVQVDSAPARFTAESGAEGLIAAVSPGYDLAQSTTVAAGDRSYRLAHQASRTDQILLLPGTYLAQRDSVLTFASRLAIATDTETALVQVSTNDGASWTDVFARTGTSPSATSFPAPTEPDFSPTTVSLGAFAGSSIRVRFVFTIGLGAAFLPEATNQVGWFLDDIVLTRAPALSVLDTTRVSTGTTFRLVPGQAGPIRLQARGLMFGEYPADWGPVREIFALPPAASPPSAQ